MTVAARLVVFAKAPVAGFSKTRLIPALGPQGAADLARRMLDHAVQQAVAAQICSVELCVTPDVNDAVFVALSLQYGTALTPQGEGDLGERMHRAFERLLREHPAAILIGTDAPAIDAPMLRAAHAALACHDAVFVPAADGGYALVGLRRPVPALFSGVPWSTAAVMQETRRKAQDAGITWLELEPVHDIDEPPDLVHLPTHWVGNSFNQ